MKPSPTTRSKPRRLITTLVAVVAVGLTLTAAACSRVNSSNGNAVAIGGAAVGQYTNIAAEGWAALINKAGGDVTATPVVTSGAVEAVQRVAAGTLSLGFTNGPVLDLAKAGKHQGIPAAMLDQVSAVVTYPLGAIQLFVLDDSPIHTVADMNGKRITGFTRGSSGWDYINGFLDPIGATYTQVPLGVSESLQALKDGQADVFVLSGPIGSAAVLELTADTKVRTIPIDGDSARGFKAAMPSLLDAVIPVGAYGANQTNTEPTATVASQIVILADPKLSDDVVYAVTKALMDNLDEFYRTVPGSEGLTLAGATDGLTVKLHPGAQRYFDEHK